MADKTSIEWTDATWNPVRGCSIVSKGCTNCYAMRQAHRHNGPGGSYEGLTKLTKGGPVWTGAMRLVPELLEQPLKWKQPRRIFVNSMSDLFHDGVPDDFILKVWQVMYDCHAGTTCARRRRADDQSNRHVFQILTKRPERMQRFVSRLGLRSGRLYLDAAKDDYQGLALPNVWLGVSVEDQAAADERIPLLLQTPAAVRWISAEPLLGPVDLHLSDHPDDVLWRRTHGGSYERAFIAWVVGGGESGHGARPMHPDWPRSLRDQCALAGVAFFFKQWGAWIHAGRLTEQQLERDFETHLFGDKTLMARVPKSEAGRELDGRTHDEYPA